MADKVDTILDDFAHVAAKAAAAEGAALELVKALSMVPHDGVAKAQLNDIETVLLDLACCRAWANCEAAKRVVCKVTI